MRLGNRLRGWCGNCASGWHLWGTGGSGQCRRLPSTRIPRRLSLPMTFQGSGAASDSSTRRADINLEAIFSPALPFMWGTIRPGRIGGTNQHARAIPAMPTSMRGGEIEAPCGVFFRNGSSAPPFMTATSKPDALDRKGTRQPLSCSTFPSSSAIASTSTTVCRSITSTCPTANTSSVNEGYGFRRRALRLSVSDDARPPAAWGRPAFSVSLSFRRIRSPRRVPIGEPFVSS